MFVSAYAMGLSLATTRDRVVASELLQNTTETTQTSLKWYLQRTTFTIVNQSCLFLETAHQRLLCHGLVVIVNFVMVSYHMAF